MAAVTQAPSPLTVDLAHDRPHELVHAHLAGPTDIPGFRAQARALFHLGVAPADVVWHVDHHRDDDEAEAAPPTTGDLWTGLAQQNMQHDIRRGIKQDIKQDISETAAQAPQPLRVPRAYATLCDEVLLHSDPARFTLMYRLLWRLQHEPTLRHDPLDADMMAAHRMARAVHRDIHKMRAFVRFTKVGDDRHVAWFEPAHHIVEANAPFFMRRFAQMRWAILTPRRCIEWDGQALHMRPGADPREAPPPDAGEALWLTYYAHIFNPARLKLQTMAREMPRRYWPNLPEAALIEPLARAAAARSHAMVAAEPSSPVQHYKPIMIQRVHHIASEPSPARGRGHGHAHQQAPHPDQHPDQHQGWHESRIADSIHSAEGAHLPSLAALREATQACRNCPIGAGATQAVCGEGPSRHASHMIVGEQPGDKEDLAGHPFVGPAGKLLSRAMAELEWPRESVYVTNAVKHFKYELRGTRRMHKTPGQREIEACLRWLDNEIELVKPDRLVALGATAAYALLGRKVAITQEHGRWLHERADGIPVLVTWHPSALLRQPEEFRAQAYARWREDLAFAKQAIGDHAPHA